MHDEDATMKVKKFQITFRLTDFNVEDGSEVIDNFFFFREFFETRRRRHFGILLNHEKATNTQNKT